ncbi:MAG: hypothetical protein MK479_02455, partial [Planctomycetes bacterium]|nr:hypothetical protein [Planctomycetota bacterium]
PERAEGERGGPRSDIFSLGLIAYEMVCGETVFPSLKGKGLVEAYCKTQIKIPPMSWAGFPAALPSWLKACSRSILSAASMRNRSSGRS